MIVCDGLEGVGCPLGSILDVELGPRRVTPDKIRRVQRLLQPHGWVLAMREAVSAAAGVIVEPLCGACGHGLRRGLSGASSDSLALEARSALLSLAVPRV